MSTLPSTEYGSASVTQKCPEKIRKCRLHACCNNPDNGAFTGRVVAIEIGNLELRGNFLDWGPKLTEGDDFIRIGGMKLRCFGGKTWHGNWCWNSYVCASKDVERLVNWPKFRKWFDMESGTVSLYEKWEAGEPLRFKRPTPGAGGAA